MDALREQIINGLKAEIAELKGQVTQLTGALQSKVDKDKVIAEINISPEAIRISGNKIHINGNSVIDDNVIKSSSIEYVAGEKIKVGSLSEINTN